MYRDAVASLRHRHPELLALGMELVYPFPLRLRLTRLFRDTIGAVRKIAAYILTRPADLRETARHPVVLAYHQILTNARGTMELLAQRARSAGVDVVLFGPQGGKEDVADAAGVPARLSSFINHAPSKRAAIRCAMHAFRVAMGLTVTLIQHSGLNLAGVWINPLSLWLRVLRVSQRITAYGIYLGSIHARAVVVTHERFAPCSELLTAARSLGLPVLHYHHGFSTIHEHPYLATTVCVWNRTDERMLRSYLPDDDVPNIHITGNAEFDLILEGADVAADLQRDAALRRQSSGRPVVLVLSQFVEAIPRLVEGTRNMLSLLLPVATANPEWYFLIKEHHVGDRIGESAGCAELRALGNTGLLGYTDATLPELLRCPTVRVVLSASSTGLYLAAGVGKTAGRLLVHGMDEPIDLIDEVAVPIREGRELTTLLRGLDDATAGHPFSHETDDDHSPFPHRGCSVDELLQLVLQTG